MLETGHILHPSAVEEIRVLLSASQNPGIGSMPIIETVVSGTEF
jgi:hypothetical protein